MNAALYIPAVMEEANVLSIFAHKGKMILRMLWEIRNHDEHLFRISTQTATNLSNIPDNSIDYIFTDPPYGGNIRYSEVNFIWEAWLQRFTNQKDEIIISECQRKDVRRYGQLLEEAFKEAYRVLRREAWMTVTFNTSDKEVWEAFQKALWGAGFDVRFVQILHKGHRSFKQLTSTHITGYDIIVTCQRRSKREKLSVSTPVSTKEAQSLIAKIAQQEARKGIQDFQLLYANVIAKLLAERRKGLLSFKEFLGLLDGEIKEVVKAPWTRKKQAQQQIALFSEDGKGH